MKKRRDLSDGLYHRVVRAISWSVLGTGLAQAVILLASIPTARLLGEIDFGRLGLVQFTLNLLYSLVAPSLGWTVMRTVASLRSINRDHLSVQLSALLGVGSVICILLALSIVFSANWIASSLFKDPDSGVPLLISSIAVLFGSFYSILISGLSGFEAFRTVALLNSVRGVLMGLGFVAGALWGGLTGSVVTMGITSAISALWACRCLGHTLRSHSVCFTPPDWVLGLRLVREFSLPAFLSTLIASMMPWLGSVLLARHAPSLSEVAVLSVANYWRTLLMFLPTQMAQSTAPILANLWGHHDYQQVKRLLKIKIKIIFLISSIILFPLFMAAEQILSLYSLTAPRQEIAFRLILVSTVFASLCAPFGYTLVAMGRFWIGLVVNAVWSILFFGITWLSIVQAKSGVVGLGWAYLISYVILFLISMIFVFHLLKQAQVKAIEGGR